MLSLFKSKYNVYGFKLNQCNENLFNSFFTRLNQNNFTSIKKSRNFASKTSSELFTTPNVVERKLDYKPRFPIQRDRTGESIPSRYRNRVFLESVAHKRKVRLPILKVYPIARVIRGLPVHKAIALLKVLPQVGANQLYKAVVCAKNNAVNRGFRAEDLEIGKSVKKNCFIKFFNKLESLLVEANI